MSEKQSEPIIVPSRTKTAEVLERLSVGMAAGERVRYIYNDAIDDAVNFVRSAGEENPDIRLASIRLSREMRRLLPLRQTREA